MGTEHDLRFSPTRVAHSPKINLLVMDFLWNREHGSRWTGGQSASNNVYDLEWTRRN